MDNDYTSAADIVYQLSEKMITRVSLDQWLVSLIADNWMLKIECSWELRDENGDQLDASCDLQDRSHFDLWRVLGKNIVGAELSPEHHVTISFDNGMILRIFSNDDSMEDWQMSNGVPNGEILICNGDDLSLFAKL